ncbi:MAG: hypothetical protein AB6733_00205 [Clostridiaceae bacterium]
MKIKCEACGEIFEMTDGFKIQDMGKSVKRTYFECAACGKEYTAYYTDEKVRYNQQKIRRLSENQKKLKGNAALKAKDEVQNLIEINKVLMNNLREEFEDV